MAKSRRLTRLWPTLQEDLSVLSKDLAASFRSTITRKTNKHDLEVPQSEDAVHKEPHEANPRFTLDADIVCKTPEAGDDIETGDDYEAGSRINTKELASAISVPSSSAQEKRKRSGEHDDSAPESARHGLEDKTSAPSDISRKSSTKKTQEIINWVIQQPETSHLSGHDAEQAPEFPPSRSDSGDLGVPEDRFDVAKGGEPQPVEFIQSSSWSSSPKRFHPPRPPHARASPQYPKTRGIVRLTDLIDLRTDPDVLIRSSASRIATGSVRLGITSGDIRVPTPWRLCIPNPVNHLHCRPVLSIEERLGDDGRHHNLWDRL